MTSKILCAIDDTDHAKNAILCAAELSSKTGAQLTVCTVNVLTGGLRGPPIYLHDDLDVRKMLDNAAALARQHGGKDLAEAELKDQNGFDQIVTGTGDKRGLSRLALGSVAADIAGRAHCTVTVAR